MEQHTLIFFAHGGWVSNPLLRGGERAAGLQDVQEDLDLHNTPIGTLLEVEGLCQCRGAL